MPQVFGSEDIDLIKNASLFSEAATEREIEQATHPEVAAEARRRGLVPLRLGGNDPVWFHEPTKKIISLTPSHTGQGFKHTRSKNNTLANLRRLFPTEEEVARANRTPEQIAAEQNQAAETTKSKKQQAAESARRKKEQQAAEQFKRDHAPFKNMGEVQRAYNSRKKIQPGDTLEDFASRLREAPQATRDQVHRLVFPERY